jgi:hypothetical protein
MSQELLGVVFTQLMEQIQKQDDLLHDWTKYYLSIQSALAVAMTYLLNLTGAGSIFLARAGLLLIPILGISTAWCFTDMIIREHIWQGHYIERLGQLQGLPQIYGSSDPTDERPGYIARRFRFLKWILLSGWSALAVVIVVGWII